MSNLVPVEVIEKKIFFLREQKVMLDRDLAELYGVEVKQLKRQARRNIERFPEDFMFVLTAEEGENLRRQFGTLKRGAHSKYLSYAFTEHGILMLSSVLNSERAIAVNIQIMRTFTKLKQMALSYGELKAKIEKMESKYDKQFHIVFQALKQMLEPPKTKRVGKIGF